MQSCAHRVSTLHNCSIPLNISLCTQLPTPGNCKYPGVSGVAESFGKGILYKEPPNCLPKRLPFRIPTSTEREFLLQWNCGWNIPVCNENDFDHFSTSLFAIHIPSFVQSLFRFVASIGKQCVLLLSFKSSV